jgi:ribonuclease HI
MPIEQPIILEFDGGSRGNPGPAGIGVVLRAHDSTPLVTLGRFIGNATSNVAEYTALVTGLEKALELGATRLLVRGDSELIIRQMTGQYRVKHPVLKPLHHDAQALVARFTEVKFDHNLREKNILADKLVNLALDRRKEVTDADESPLDTPAAEAPSAGDQFLCARCGCLIQLKVPSSIRPHQLRPFLCQCGMKMYPR